jgi:hypothetical protein
MRIPLSANAIILFMAIIGIGCSSERAADSVASAPVLKGLNGKEFFAPEWPEQETRLRLDSNLAGS